MTDVLVVDWLGRGGIAQTTEAWALELAGAGARPTVVTRAGRELGSGEVAVLAPPERGPALVAHARLCRFAAREVRRRRPAVVVVQNYVVPVLEEVVHRAARRVGARVVFVVHDDRHHERGEGLHGGLARQVRAADAVVAHSAAVAEGVGRPDVVVVPHPAPIGMARHAGTSPVAPVPGRLLALHFGVLRRGYKGTELISELAAAGDDRWAYALAGVGAPAVPGAQSVDRFLDPGDLVAAVRAADAVVLPYHHATQSGAVVLAQLCGTPPVASAVGGITEQVEDGVTGLLVPPGAGPDAWRRALAALEDPAVRARMGAAGQAAVAAQHDRFRAGIVAVTGVGQAGADRPATRR